MDNIKNYINRHFETFTEDLFTCLRFASISTDSEFKGEVLACADYLCEHLKDIGLENVQQFQTAGHPAIYADYLHAENAPTILIYGHYDVQPSEPDNLWVSPPFTPVIRDGQIMARGASDDKGQVFCHLKAIQTLLSVNGSLAINIKLIIEGEEEIGSENFFEFVDSHKDLLHADLLLLSDTPMLSEEQPSLSISLRGLLYFELQMRTAAGDLHSGQHGGAVPNALTEMVSLLSKLKDAQNTVLIPGFYDDVNALSPALQLEMDKVPYCEPDYLSALGIKKLITQKGFGGLESRWFRPTLDINGLKGGYTCEGAKTVIPATAMAKLSMRLVAGQDPVSITTAFYDYVQGICPDYVDLEIENIKASRPSMPFMADIKDPAIEVAKNSIEYAFGKRPVLNGEGGSVPIVSYLQKALGMNAILMGFNLPYDKIHAPNEQFAIERYRKGILACAHFYSSL